MAKKGIRNNVFRTVTIFSLALLLVGIGLFVIGLSLDSYETTWMIFIGFFLIITGAVCAGIFGKMASDVNSLFQEKNLLAHWKYSAEEPKTRASKGKDLNKRTNKFLWLIVAGFVVFFSALFIIFGKMDEDAILFFLGIMGGVLAITGLAAWLAPLSTAKKIEASLPEAFISEKGAWVMGEAEVWKSGISRLKAIKFDVPLMQILITYEVMARYGYQTRTVQIPVPKGEEKTAIFVIDRIAQANGLLQKE